MFFTVIDTFIHKFTPQTFVELWASRDKAGLLSKTPWSAEIYTQTACYRIRTVMRAPRSMASEYWAQPGGGGRRSGEKREHKSQSRVEVDTEKESIQPKKKAWKYKK